MRTSKKTLPRSRLTPVKINWTALWLVTACAAASAAATAAPPDARSAAMNAPPPSAVACSACHGAAGEGNSAAAFPRLAGLGSSYVVSQLDGFADGTRVNPVMGPIAKALTADQKKVVANYYASLPTPFTRVNVDSADIEPGHAGAWLANRGRWNDGIPACVGCHGPGGAGVSPVFPPLAGQPAAYLATQLNEWKAGRRSPGPQAFMSQVASKLDSADIEAVSQYFGSLRPATAAPSKHPGDSK